MREPARPHSLTIDMHCHVLTLAVEAHVAEMPQKKAETAALAVSMGEESVIHNNSVMLPQAFPKLTQLSARLADMDALGIDVQVISPSPTQYYYWAEMDLSRELVRLQNEYIASLIQQYSTRLAGLGTVSLQHPELAAEQLRVALTVLGLKGVEISTAVNGMELSNPALYVFWKMAEDLGAVIFLHPFGSTLGERTREFYLVNTIGQPLETTLALSHLMFGGVLDKFPNLKIIAAHGGGYLPTYMGRSVHAFTERPEASAKTGRSPSQHLKRIWFDSIVYDSLGLRHLIERVGPRQVVIGTDYPFDMGHYDVHGLFEQVRDLSDRDRNLMLGGNAASLIGWRTE